MYYFSNCFSESLNLQIQTNYVLKTAIVIQKTNHLLKAELHNQMNI